MASYEGGLICPESHFYPIVEGIPILLVEEMEQTHIEGDRSLAVARAPNTTVLPHIEAPPGGVDPFVSRAIGATNGSLYQHLVGNLRDYPIPELRLPSGKGQWFLEVGCNWGRWCIAAARQGYKPVGIDPSLKSIRAARRVAQQLGVEAHYVVADGRALPFGRSAFGQIFSYSVLQHLSKENAEICLAEMRRVLARDGNCLLQMPNAFGLRCLYHQARRRFRKAQDFEVRYWTPSHLASVFSKYFDNAQITVDGFFSLNPQISDLRLFPRKYRALVTLSDLLRQLSVRVPQLRWIADSLYISSSGTGA